MGKYLKLTVESSQVSIWWKSVVLWHGIDPIISWSFLKKNKCHVVGTNCKSPMFMVLNLFGCRICLHMWCCLTCTWCTMYFAKVELFPYTSLSCPCFPEKLFRVHFILNVLLYYWSKNTAYKFLAVSLLLLVQTVTLSQCNKVYRLKR